MEHKPDNLKQLIDKLQRNFLDNMYATRKSFESHKIDIKEVTDYVQEYTPLLLYLSFRKHQPIELIQEKFDQTKTMKQLFGVLKKYTSWYNFEFIVKLVENFINDDSDLLRKWSTYHERLKDYFKNNDTQAVQIGDAIQFGLSDVPGTKVMVAKVEKDDYTMNDLYFFRKAIAEALSKVSGDSDCKFYLCKIADGCMELKYSIPDAIYSALLTLNQSKSYKFKFLLAKTGITEMKFSGSYCIPIQQV